MVHFSIIVNFIIFLNTVLVDNYSEFLKEIHVSVKNRTYFLTIERNFMLHKYFWLCSIYILKTTFIESINFYIFSLKPENILIDKQGYVRLIDFGLSCYVKRKKDENVNKISGTP
jgi:serine/threonine protein kinase